MNTSPPPPPAGSPCAAGSPASSTTGKLDPLTGWALQRRFWTDTWRDHKVQLGLLALAFVGLITLVGFTSALHFPGLRDSTGQAAPAPGNWPDWLQRVQAVFGLLTLGVALLVWHGEVREDWLQSLPKLLSVYFFYDKTPVFVCRQAWLGHEGDIRAMGQSIGQQINNGRLDFVPYLDVAPPLLVIDGARKVSHHYRVKFRLVEVPTVARLNPADGKTVGTAFLWHGEADDKAKAIAPTELLAQPDVAAWLGTPRPPG